MSNLPFLLTLFPTFSLNEPHFLSLEYLETLLQQNLSKKDLRAANEIWILGDVENVRSFLKNEPMNHKGSIDCEKLASMMITGEKLPVWLARFFKEIPEDQRVEKSSLLSWYCLKYAPQKVSQKTVQELLQFEFVTRSILEYVRCKECGVPFSTELDLLKKPEAEWPELYQDLIAIWNKNKRDPLNLEQQIAEWKFHFLENQRDKTSHFSLSRLIFSLALFRFIESRRPLKDETKNILQERIIRTLVQ